jgi:hypothetical protein
MRKFTKVMSLDRNAKAFQILSSGRPADHFGATRLLFKWHNDLCFGYRIKCLTGGRVKAFKY